MTSQHIGIFITGGIAAYKTPQLIRELLRAGAEVRVAMTPSASAFVTEETLRVVSKHAVLTDANQTVDPLHIAHVELAHWLDLAVVVPATANTIAKLAQGFADNIVTTTLLAYQGPALVVPAMNDQMWLSPRTQANVAQLVADGRQVLTPATGALAEGYQAVGRMPDLAVIETAISAFQPTPFMAGKKIVVTAGGTREPLDPVRYLTNESSGKMGTALANAAAAAGAAVTLVTTHPLPVLPGVNVEVVTSARTMQEAVMAVFPSVDVAVMAAAVADYRPTQVATEKIKKTGDAGLTLTLTQNPDILAQLGAAKTHQLVVGFAAETTDLLVNAQAKLAKKHADVIIANQVGDGKGFDQATNAVTLLWPERPAESLPEQPKLALAAAIWQRLMKN